MSTADVNEIHASYCIGILLRVPVPWVFVVTYLVGLGLQLLFPFSIDSPDARHAFLVVGAVFFAIGAAIATWSLVIFKKARTTTTPGETSRELIIRGPYRFSRNPMYVSLILAYIGEAAMLSHTWPLVMFPLTVAYVHWIVVPLEESSLKETFGEKYEHYRLSVGRWV